MRCKDEMRTTKNKAELDLAKDSKTKHIRDTIQHGERLKIVFVWPKHDTSALYNEVPCSDTQTCLGECCTNVTMLLLVPEKANSELVQISPHLKRRI